MKESYIARRQRAAMKGKSVVPFSYAQLEQAAKDELEKGGFGYIASGAGEGETKETNSKAFEKWRIVPRVFEDVSEQDLRVDIFDYELATPLFTSPVPLGLAHKDGVLATAEEASSLGVSMIQNTGSSISMEELSEQVEDLPRLFQLYWSSDWDVTASMVERAEKAGFGAIVVTVDSRVPRWKGVDLENSYSPFDHIISHPNYFDDPVFRAALDDPPDENREGAIEHMVQILSDPALSWDNLGFLRSHTTLPIVVKGILHPEDAQKALEYGVDGIVVSNHGGRQVRGSIGSIEALPAIVEQIDNEIPILFDSGIRNGADVFKAIALGADAVCIGRPILYGLAVGGQPGVREMLGNILAEFESILGLSGYQSVEEIDSSSLREIPAVFN